MPLRTIHRVIHCLLAATARAPPTLLTLADHHVPPVGRAKHIHTQALKERIHSDTSALSPLTHGTAGRCQHLEKCSNQPANRQSVRYARYPHSSCSQAAAEQPASRCSALHPCPDDPCNDLLPTQLVSTRVSCVPAGASMLCSATPASCSSQLECRAAAGVVHVICTPSTQMHP